MPKRLLVRYWLEIRQLSVSQSKIPPSICKVPLGLQFISMWWVSFWGVSNGFIIWKGVPRPRVSTLKGMNKQEDQIIINVGENSQVILCLEDPS